MPAPKTCTDRTPRLSHNSKPSLVRAGLAPVLKPSTLNPKPFNTAISFDWNLQDISVINSLSNQAFFFAHTDTLDSYNILKTAADKAIKEGLTFKDFKLELEGLDIKNPYNLRTNFNTAISNATIAGKYAGMLEDKDIFPYLRYVAIIDGRTRDEHLELHGIVRTVDDPFWDNYLPPNGWNCRCDVEQLTRDEADADPNGKERTIPPIKPDKNFQKNTYKTQKLAKDAQDPEKYNKLASDKDKLNLDSIEKIRQRATDAYSVIEKDNIKEYVDYFNKNIKGMVYDKIGNPVDIGSKLLNHIIKYKSEKTQIERMQNINMLKPTLTNPDEIWIQKRDDGSLKRVYLKMFKDTTKGGFCIVEFEGNSVTTFFLPKKDNYFNNNRFGMLLRNQ